MSGDKNAADSSEHLISLKLTCSSIWKYRFAIVKYRPVVNVKEGGEYGAT